jgi:hypothetical protein
VAQLPRQHAQLPAVMCFVSNEVTEEVYEIGREVLPGGWWYCATPRRAEPDQINHAAAAARECARQLSRTNYAAIDSFWHRHTVPPTDHFDPHAPRVVNVSSDHPNGATRSAGDVLGPQLWRQILDEIGCNALVCVPRVDQRLGIIVIFGHARSSEVTHQ